MQLKAQRKRLQECNKKIKQRIKEQRARLTLNEQEIDNVDMNISQLENIRDNEKDQEDMDMK